MTTAPQVTSPRHDNELLLQQLTGRHRDAEGRPILHELGLRGSSNPAQTNRVVWIDTGPGPSERIGYTIPATVTIGRQPLTYDVEISGASPAEVYARCREIEGWLDVLVGPPQGAPPPAGNGYKVGKPSVPVQGGDGSATGWCTTMSVTLYQPIFSEVRPLLTVAHPSVTATAAAGQGANNAGEVAWQG